MKSCLKKCLELEVSCPVKECKYWISYEQDYNCCIKSIDDNGAMTLRESADRLDLSFVRVKQIQDKAMTKVVKSLNKDKAY